MIHQYFIIIIFLSLVTLVVFPVGAIVGVVIGDSTIRGAAGYGSREDTAPNGWVPAFVNHAGTLSGELQNNQTSGNTWYNDAIGGDVSGVPGTNGALSNTPEGVKNRWWSDAMGGTDTSLGDSPRPTSTLSSKPDVVIVGVGINDCVYNGTLYGGYAWTLDTTENNMYWMALNATQNKVKTIFLVPEPAAGYCSITYQTSLKSWMLSNLSTITRVYNTWTLLNDPNNNGYMLAPYASDNVHPNDAGWIYLTQGLVANDLDYLSPLAFTPPFDVYGVSKISGGSLYVPLSISSPNNTSILATNADTGETYSSTIGGSNIILSRSGSFSSGQYSIRIVYPMKTYIMRGTI